MKWEVVIGLETHAQLSTTSKIFSGASTAFGAKPNTQACAVDIALPGVLPVLNKGAVERAIRFGLAVGAKINRRSIFARKNYFYPDLPKGYQISQYETPIVEGGSLTILVNGEEKTVRLTRAHLEEDAGKSLHEDFQGATGIDLNRAGTPLLEIVTEPDMRSAAEAVAYAKALHRLIVEDIEICDGNMQEGSFRCDANVSIRPTGSDKFGTRREIKNLNSFAFLQQAIEFERNWQIETLENGGSIQQATVLFDPDTGETRTMRTKEDAHDYRYFPDPDLLPLEVTEEFIDQIKASKPKSLEEQRQEMIALGLEGTANQITSSRAMSTFALPIFAKFDQVEDRKVLANWILGPLSAKLNEENLDISQSKVTGHQLIKMYEHVKSGAISASTSTNVLLAAMWAGEYGGDPDAIIAAKGLKQISDTNTIEKIVDEVLAANAQQVADYKAGKEKAFNSLVGQVMKATKGKANPQQVNDILKRKLAG